MAVLRLHNWLEFVRDVVAKKHQIILRDGPSDQKLNDRVFEHEMRKAIKESDLAYSKLLFKDALKGMDSTYIDVTSMIFRSFSQKKTLLNSKSVGFFELQTVLNKYRELCGSEGMHRELINKACFINKNRLIETQKCLKETSFTGPNWKHEFCSTFLGSDFGQSATGKMDQSCFPNLVT